MVILPHKSVVVTGAGRGLGRDIALAFARCSRGVGLLDLNGAALEKVAAEVERAGAKVLTRVCNVADRSICLSACKSIVDAFGPIDALISNAVYTKYEPVEDITEEALERTLGVAVKAAIWGAQAIVQFAPPEGGSLINMTSATAVLGFRNAAAYSAAKGAIAALTRQLAVELGPRNIRVNALAPGPIRTPGSITVVNDDGWRSREARTPLGRLSDGADIGTAAVFLASDSARFITGQVLAVDGGFTIAGP